MRSGWLLRDGDVVCALELAETGPERRSGLRARGAERGAGAVHLSGVWAVHGVGLPDAVDLAFLADDLTVVRVTRLAPWRISLCPRRIRRVLHAEAGAFERWGVAPGDQLEIREVP
jgi:uncharacterized membrane protein (UPF0127 family)